MTPRHQFMCLPLTQSHAFAVPRLLVQHHDKMQQPECHTCKLLRSFLEDLQLLFIQLQQRPCHPVPETSRVDESKITPHEHLEGSNDSEGPSKSTGTEWRCQDPECSNKPKTLFTTRKNFVRHYTQHVKCTEKCRFCDTDITNVREYVTHFDKCDVKKRQEELGSINSTIKNEAIERRRSLLKIAGHKVNQSAYTASRVGGETLSVAPEAQVVDAGRKRRRTMDPPPEQILSHTISATRGLHEDHAGPTNPSTSMQGSQTCNREAAVTSCMTFSDNYESGPPSRITEAPSETSTAFLLRAPFAGSYTIDEPFDATRAPFANSSFDATQPPLAPFADSYTIDKDFNGTLSPQARFPNPYLIDKSFDETPHQQAHLDTSHSPDGGLGPVSQYPASVATTIQQHGWTRSTGM
ncbi:hypothetical protein FJTKL_08960 [Diaporthe vaccinii]|uniref:C2H2-type domain-containing protein n=1 Tax=Diaporthe vaccinii TaxID=105482 RepID=A0ABR4DPW7_9PEZI